MQTEIMEPVLVPMLLGEVAELAERLDFAERLLAKSRETDRIGPGRS